MLASLKFRKEIKMSYVQMKEEQDFHHSASVEWDCNEAAELGSAHKDLAWIVTGSDTVHQNPHYQGPAVPHPYDAEQAYYAQADAIEDQDRMEARGGPVFCFDTYDDIPF